MPVPQRRPKNTLNRKSLPQRSFAGKTDSQIVQVVYQGSGYIRVHLSYPVVSFDPAQIAVFYLNGLLGLVAFGEFDSETGTSEDGVTWVFHLGFEFTSVIGVASIDQQIRNAFGGTVSGVAVL